MISDCKLRAENGRLRRLEMAGCELRKTCLTKQVALQSWLQKLITTQLDVVIGVVRADL
jgi:hypothetical protein